MPSAPAWWRAERLVGAGPCSLEPTARSGQPWVAALHDAALEAFGAHAPVDVELVERLGGAHDELLKEAADADVLVVGARGQTGSFRALLGTTAQFCAEHASCAVLVVPPTDRPTAG